MRGIYKDLIVMLHGDDLIDDNQLKAKTESSFFGDRMVCALIFLFLNFTVPVAVFAGSNIWLSLV